MNLGLQIVKEITAFVKMLNIKIHIKTGGRILGWGIRPSQGLCLEFSKFFLVEQSDSSLVLL
jgi:hypothetical protein